jgi:hypothetical protein
MSSFEVDIFDNDSSKSVKENILKRLEREIIEFEKHRIVTDYDNAGKELCTLIKKKVEENEGEE